MAAPLRLYASYYRQLDAATRLPEDNKFDLRREAIDAMFFPNFHKEIVFGALTLDGLGTTAYGGATIILKEAMISHRATVFDENTFLFVERHKLKATDDIPEGYRATWANRGRLAVAKLHSSLNANTPANDFAQILLRQKTPSVEDDFIEVHIYQGFSRGAIEKIVYTKTRNKVDTHLLKVLREKAATANITIEEV